MSNELTSHRGRGGSQVDCGGSQVGYGGSQVGYGGSQVLNLSGGAQRRAVACRVACRVISHEMVPERAACVITGVQAQTGVRRLNNV